MPLHGRATSKNELHRSQRWFNEFSCAQCDGAKRFLEVDPADIGQNPTAAGSAPDFHQRVDRDEVRELAGRDSPPRSDGLIGHRVG
jgi:hypothetical protein